LLFSSFSYFENLITLTIVNSDAFTILWKLYNYTF